MIGRIRGEEACPPVPEPDCTGDGRRGEDGEGLRMEEEKMGEKKYEN